MQDENEDNPASIELNTLSPFDNMDGTYDDLDEIPTEDLFRIKPEVTSDDLFINHPDATRFSGVETLSSENSSMTAFFEGIPFNEKLYAACSGSPVFEFPDESELRNTYLPEVVTDSFKPLIPTSARVPKEQTTIQFNSLLTISPLECLLMYAIFPIFTFLVYSQSSEFLGFVPLCRFFSILAGFISFFYLAILPISRGQKTIIFFKGAIIYFGFNCLLDYAAA